MKPPCEIVVKSILPAIRSILVKDLMEKHELTQMEIAERLGITQPAVSQYLKSARGFSRTKENLVKSRTLSKLKKLSKKIYEEEIEKARIIKNCCEICKSMKKKRLLCDLHFENEPYLKKENCTICENENIY